MALLASESDLASEITSVLLWAALSLIGAGKKRVISESKSSGEMAN